MAALRGSTLCWNHDPRKARVRIVARRKGGRRSRVTNASAPVGARTIPELQDLLQQAIADVLQHPNSLQRSNALRGLLQAGRALIDDCETKTLLEEIKDELAQQRRIKE
jgi:hypothetical protein